MLSSATLERVSVSYRRGYHAGYAGEPLVSPNNDPLARPFGDHDYAQGHAAGLNDMRWSKFNQLATPEQSDAVWAAATKEEKVRLVDAVIANG